MSLGAFLTPAIIDAIVTAAAPVVARDFDLVLSAVEDSMRRGLIDLDESALPDAEKAMLAARAAAEKRT